MSERKEVSDKALFILNSFEGGGAERICIYLAKELSKTHSVDVITLYAVEDYKVDELDNINYYTLGIKKQCGHLAKLFQELKALKKFNRFVKLQEKSKPYSLITSHLTAAHVLTRLSSVGRRCLYVHHSLISAVESHFSRFTVPFLRWLYRSVQCVCVSEGVRTQLVHALNLQPENVCVVRAPIDIEEIHKKARKDRLDYRPYLLFVGRLAKSKHPEKILEIYLRGNFKKEFDVVFLGQGPLQQQLKDITIQKGIEEKVHFNGFVDNPYSWMRNAACMILTSDRESLSMVIIEALASGGRVVSSDCDFGPREIMIGDLSQYLVQTDDVNAYINAIDQALKDYPNISRDFFKEYEPNYVIKKYLERYAEVFAV